MNKQEAISMMAQIVNGTKVESEKHFNAFLQVLEYCATSKEDLKINGYFTMETVERAERSGRNPSTKESITIPAHNSLKMTPKSVLKGLVE